MTILPSLGINFSPRIFTICPVVKKYGLSPSVLTRIFLFAPSNTHSVFEDPLSAMRCRDILFNYLGWIDD